MSATPLRADFLCRVALRFRERVFSVLTFMSVMLFTVVSGGAGMADTPKVFVFGNSLFHHLSDTERTTVPHWLAYFAKRNSETFELDGRWGFMRNFANDLPPKPQWKFEGVAPAWNRQYRRFEDVGYSHIVFNPANFIQNNDVDKPYDGDNPTNVSPLEATVELLRNVGDGKKVVIYEGWGLLKLFSKRFPPRGRALRKYHAYNVAEYHDWYVTYLSRLQEALPGVEIELLPVARILSRAFLETGLQELEATDIYEDDAPHGTDNLYFLASVPVYAQLFGTLPTSSDVPEDLHPLIKRHFEDFLDIVREEMPVKSAATFVPEQKAEIVQQSPVESAQNDIVTAAPALGYGLNGISDWSTQVPFVNLMKSARPWTGHLQGQFGGWNEEQLETGGFLDADGWPTRIPDDVTKIETFMLTDFPEEAVGQAGIYRLQWEGEGKIDLAGRPRALRYGEREIWFRFSAGDGAIGVAVSETDPNQTGDYVRNLSVVREDQIPLFEAGVTFNPEWLKVVEDARLLRFMDWMFTNGSTVETWNDRPTESDYTYARRGVPLEVMIDLVNQVGADPWFNMPHKADDAYVHNFAEYVQQNLRAGLRVHTEYSNEMWNFIFPQTHWAAAQAKELWGDEASDDAWMQFYGLRSAQIAAIWSDVFAQNMTRLNRVVGVHTGWLGLEQGALNAPLAVADGAQVPKSLFDSYAVTGYFGHEYGAQERAELLLNWRSEGKATGQGDRLALDRLARDIKERGLVELTENLWPYHAAVAADHGFELIMYEGGTHLAGHDVWVNDDELTELLIKFNYSDEIGDVYLELLNAWHEVGGTVFNAFVDVANPSKWGSWGTRRYLGDQTPRSQTLESYNKKGAVWRNSRPEEAFEAGVVLQGGGEADVLIGTRHSDVLLGGAGNDEFRAGAGKNYLNGQTGEDHAVLPGFLEEYRFTSEGERLVAHSAQSTTRLFSIETLSFSETPALILPTSDLF